MGGDDIANSIEHAAFPAAITSCKAYDGGCLHLEMRYKKRESGGVSEAELVYYEHGVSFLYTTWQ